MRISKWGNSLAVRIPKDVVKALDLDVGDEIELTRRGPGVLEVSKVREDAIARIRAMAKPLPPGWKFDREEANAR
jgi:antitoxin MazE